MTLFLHCATQVREEYAAVRSRAEAAGDMLCVMKQMLLRSTGSPMAYSPSLEQLEADFEDASQSCCKLMQVEEVQQKFSKGLSKIKHSFS